MLFPNAQPNAAHKALARLEQQGKLKAVITQNIYGLHQKAVSREVKQACFPGNNQSVLPLGILSAMFRLQLACQPD